MSTLVLGISGSIRSNYKHVSDLEQFVNDSNDQKELNDKIIDSKLIFSNTDIVVANALLGAKNNGSEIRMISIPKIFKKNSEKYYVEFNSDNLAEGINDIDTLSISDVALNSLFEVVNKADGIVLGTPVYFGDRSSVCNKFLQLTNSRKLLKDKAFGVVSVGAKRNGGQETTNIYTLYEALMQESVVVGNGPVSAQYGGTVWAGDLNMAVNDLSGLDSCFGTGSRVAQLSEILKIGAANSNKKRKLEITVLITMGSADRKFEKLITDYFSPYSDQSINIINLIDHKVYRCIACNTCPYDSGTENVDSPNGHNCIIQGKTDSMEKIRELMNRSDCIVIAGINTNTSDLMYRYQAFMERTRFIRRNNFELTNISVIGLLVNELAGFNNPIHNIKVLTSFIRHNTFVLKPLNIVLKNEKCIYKDDFLPYLDILQQIKVGRNSMKPLSVSYKADGYVNKTLDSTDALRK